MDYSILMEKEKLTRVLNELENNVDDIVDSMVKFDNLWSNIYQSCKNNHFDLSEIFDSLIISIYNDWKDKSSIIRQIGECLDCILHELKAMKKNKILNKSIIAGVNQEVQNLSNAVSKFEIDKNAIEYITKECQKNKQQETLPEKSVLYWFLYNKRRGLGTISSILLLVGFYHAIQNNSFSNIDKYFIGRGGITIATCVYPFNYSSKKVKLWMFNYSLSKLSQSSIEMNTKLRNFGLLVSANIGRADMNIGKDQEANHYSTAFDIEIDGLIKITQKLWDCFRRVHDQTLQNENHARSLVLKHIPRFLIKN